MQDFPGGWAGDKHNAFTAEGRTQAENQAMNINILKLLGKRCLARGHRCSAACSQEQSEAKCR